MDAWKVQAFGARANGASDICAQMLSPRDVKDQTLRSVTLDDSGVYSRAAQRSAWEVSEVTVNNLPGHTTEESLTRTCRKFGHHVVRLKLSKNPINDVCTGEAAVLLRRCPGTASTSELVDFLDGRPQLGA